MCLLLWFLILGLRESGFFSFLGFFVSFSPWPPFFSQRCSYWAGGNLFSDAVLLVVRLLPEYSHCVFLPTVRNKGHCSLINLSFTGCEWTQQHGSVIKYPRFNAICGTRTKKKDYNLEWSCRKCLVLSKNPFKKKRQNPLVSHMPFVWL